MDVARVLNELWRRKRWVAFVLLIAVVAATLAAYRVSFTPAPRLESRSFEYGSATTTIVLDATYAPLVDVRGDLEPLALRARAYARLIGSSAVLVEVARTIGVHPTKITALAGGAGGEEERSNRLIAEEKEYQLATASEDQLPVVTVFVKGPSGQDAIKFATAVVSGFSKYLEEQQRSRNVPESARINISSLGPPQGGVVNEGVATAMLGLAFIGTFLGGCFLIVIVSGIASGWRALSSADWSSVRGEDPELPLDEQVPLDIDDSRPNGTSAAGNRGPGGVLRLRRSGRRG